MIKKVLKSFQKIKKKKDENENKNDSSKET